MNAHLTYEERNQISEIKKQGRVSVGNTPL